MTGIGNLPPVLLDYFQHEQKMFLKFLEAGLAYRKESWVNWDPVENTVLANEQVVDGCGWRSGAPVERRLLSQWFLKITEFADELLTAIDGLDRWPDRVRLMQANWIGKSEGARVKFQLNQPLNDEINSVEVFTTRPDTLFGASFIAVAANHPLAQNIGKTNQAAADFITECAKLGTSEAAIETAEKRGFETGLLARHPLDSSISLPVYIANFVLMEYGTGAILAVQLTINEILDFANAYHLPVTPVVLPHEEDATSFTITDTAYTGPGRLINSRDWNGLDIESGKKAAIAALEAVNAGRAKPHSVYVIGAYHVNAIGAVQYRSSIAHHAARCQYLKLICRSPYQKMLILRLQAIHLPTTQAGNIPNARIVVVNPRGNRTHLTHFLRALGIFCVIQIQRIKMGLAPPTPLIGCQWTNILAVLNMPFCIFFIRGFSPVP